MNTNKTLLLSLLALASLGGCASMSGDECVTSDWHAIGFEDGARGYGADSLANRRKACAKHGVTPDFTAYQNGRSEGLEQYCQPSRAFSIGTNGGRYNGVCSAHRESDFIDAYNSGYHLYNLRSRVNATNAEISSREQQLDRNRKRIKQKEATLIALDTSIQDRVLILSDLKELSEANGQLDSEIVQLIEERALHQRELASYEALLADSGH